MDLKLIGIGAVIGAILTISFSLIFFPLIFLGPLIGGFLSSYLSKGYEDYKGMDEKDGMVVGAISGFIGAFLISLLFIVGIGDISSLIGLISDKIGPIGDNFIIKDYIIFQFSVIMSTISGLLGGVLGVMFKR